jgi:two-component system LytT family sensor kinase
MTRTTDEAGLPTRSDALYDLADGAAETNAICAGCGLALPADAAIYVCSHESTFCETCSSHMHNVCSHCQGKLVRRFQRMSDLHNGADINHGFPGVFRSWIIWALSAGVWTFVTLAYAITVYELYRSTGGSMSFLGALGMAASQVLTYVPLTPFVFAFAIRFQIQRNNWARSSLILLAGGLAFTLVQVALHGMTPYAFWDPRLRHWVSAVWDTQTHALHIQWFMYKRILLSNLVDDIVTVYLPIVLAAHVASYYHGLRERELRTSQLQAQLEKARLQSLKSQLQPHFLFNTLNSISALMLTNVQAADRMITRLGDLLRISLETAGTQMTTLSRELEFVNCYIEIEKVRFEERLKVHIDVAPETLDASVPHLLLQPLVDNAIKHGISRRASGGEIRISATHDDDDLHLEVRDNGPGFRDASHSRSGGMGLRITRERLETIYGQDQSMELLSPPDGGVVARVCIPLRLAADARESLSEPAASVAPA